MAKKNEYDVVIIGAGISGLVCGCYLAKAGMKVLIVEKNAQPGGYCTSFTRQEFSFDACAHSLGSLRPGGNIFKVIHELDIAGRINLIRNDPQDRVVYPDGSIYFWNDLNKTIDELQKKFPKEAPNIKEFFYFINDCQGVVLNSLQDIVYEKLLDRYFKDFKLKALLSMPILGNIGVPPSKVSALGAVVLLKEFILDGGYYPKGGMQQFPDALTTVLKEAGGEILMPSFVTKIFIKNNCAKGIEVNGSDFISSKYVISNVDGRQTYFDLIGKEFLDKNTVNLINSLNPSLSSFILYLGLEKEMTDLTAGLNTWILPSYDLEKQYNLTLKDGMENIGWFLMHLLPDKKSLIALVNSPFNDFHYWFKNKKRLSDNFLKKINQAVPGLLRNVAFMEAATPHTLFKWTLNYHGAAYGWANVPSQFPVPGLSRPVSVKNIYLTGHWATSAMGIPGVAYIGRNTAQSILLKEKSFVKK